MKKLLVLLMVLGLAASAQAALTLNLSATSVAVGSDVTLTVYSDTADAWGIGDLILSEDQSAGGWTDPIAASWDGVTFHKTAGAGCVGDAGYATPASGYVATYLLNAAGSTVLPEAGNQFVFSIKGVQAGTIYVGLQDDSSWLEISTNGPVSLVVTPEPITMALLGLGGLFLRRRK